MGTSVLDVAGAVTAPQLVLCRQEKISLSLLRGLFVQGEVDSVIVGDRFRHVILLSWYAYLRRKQLGLERDPAEREAAAAQYRASIKPGLTAAATRARTGKTKPGRPRSRVSRAPSESEADRLEAHCAQQIRRKLTA